MLTYAELVFPTDSTFHLHKVILQLNMMTSTSSFRTASTVPPFCSDAHQVSASAGAVWTREFKEFEVLLAATCFLAKPGEAHRETNEVLLMLTLGKGTPWRAEVVRAGTLS